MNIKWQQIVLATLFIFSMNQGFSQEENQEKTKFTEFLAKSYYSINFGAIFYPFSNEN